MIHPRFYWLPPLTALAGEGYHQLPPHRSLIPIHHGHLVQTQLQLIYSHEGRRLGANGLAETRVLATIISLSLKDPAEVDRSTLLDRALAEAYAVSIIGTWNHYRWRKSVATGKNA